MPDHSSAAPTVVVGIDGSRNAVDAALWAVDEAVRRDIPLRLVYAIDAESSAPDDAARELAKAEVAVRYAVMAVESTNQPVKIEVEILQERPIRALRETSRGAATRLQRPDGLNRSCTGRLRTLPGEHRAKP
jgi:nucleotide-binding universal stress UspA family protein